MTALDDLADRYVEEFASLDPCTATMLGVAGHDAGLTDYGPEGLAARTDLARRTLAGVAAAPAGGGDRARVGAVVLRERLEADLALAGAGVVEADLNCLDGPLQRLRQAIEVLDQGPGTPWEELFARVRGLPAALAGLRRSVAGAAAAGRIAAGRQVVLNVRQSEQITGYLSELAGRYGDGPLAAGLGAAVGAAQQALLAFGEFLTREILPRAPLRDGLGRDRYELEVRGQLGARLDLAETYAWGWEELARIGAQMRSHAAAIAPGEPLPAVFAALDADPAYQVMGADRFRGWLQELADEAIAGLDGVHFDIPAELRRIGCRIPPTDAGGIYYVAPSQDRSRPGQVWWTVRAGTKVIPTWTVPAIMYHEGVPGHHLQLGTAVLSACGNRFQRMSWQLHPGACEGWGLYAERLMGELGYYTDPAYALGMLAGGQLLRAARVVLDIGMHLELEIPKGAGFHEGERWTRELGLEFLRRQIPDDDRCVVFEIDRYLGRPGQALAYKVGERVWLEAREAARRRHGAAFDLREFHRSALDLGGMGLDLLRLELARL